MSNYPATLESFKGRSSRYTCPLCNSKFEFSKYINTQTGEYIADHVGRCNRELNCGYHYTPKQYYEDNKYSIEFQKQPSHLQSKPQQSASVQKVDNLPLNLLERSLKGYESNHFYTFLKSLFGHEIAAELVSDYCVGTSKHWPGANVFWQADYHGNLRQAKIMLYNPDTGRRVKDQGDKVYFAGKTLLNNYDANLQQCFFGEILLSIHPERNVAIVESEKTAMIASVYFPDLVWLATGGSHGCKWTQKDVCNVLEGRNVILFPDIGFYDKWIDKAGLVRQMVNCNIVVSDLLEKNGTAEQKQAGWDLADYLLLNRDSSGWAMTAEDYPLIWDLKISA